MPRSTPAPLQARAMHVRVSGSRHRLHLAEGEVRTAREEARSGGPGGGGRRRDTPHPPSGSNSV